MTAVGYGMITVKSREQLLWQFYCKKKKNKQTQTNKQTNKQTNIQTNKQKNTTNKQTQHIASYNNTLLDSFQITKVDSF